MGEEIRILIVDDDKIVRIILSDMLEINGFKNIEKAVNGAEALEKAKVFRPDLILTDMMMPEMDGFQLIQAVRNDEVLSSTAIIVLTSREEMKELVEMTGVENFITKPFVKENVLETVRTVLKKIKPAEESPPPKPKMEPGKGKSLDVLKSVTKKAKKAQPDTTPLHEKIRNILNEDQ